MPTTMTGIIVAMRIGVGLSHFKKMGGSVVSSPPPVCVHPYHSLTCFLHSSLFARCFASLCSQLFHGRIFAAAHNNQDPEEMNRQRAQGYSQVIGGTAISARDSESS